MTAQPESVLSAPVRIRHWIDGAPYDGPADAAAEVTDPATGRVSGLVDLADAAVVDSAVAAAVAAAREWRQASLSRRTAVLFAFRELLHARRAELGAVITAEHGKVLTDADGEVQRGLEVVEFACGIPQLLKGGFSENVSTNVDSYGIRQPLGVVAVISPFNFPAMVPLWFVPMAIACGNAVILKPSEKDPSAANLIASLWAEAGLPAGVLNVVHGQKPAVDRLLEHPDVKAVSFVGSTPIARYVYETATRHGKRVQALGGAKNHMVVLPDADLDLAADAPSAPASARRRAVPWRSPLSVAVTPVGTSSSPYRRAHREAEGRRTAGTPAIVRATWVRSSPAEHRARSSRTGSPGGRPGEARRRTAGAADRRSRRGLLARSTCSDAVNPS
jgi:malonate-semialdehyde dehydrogenase (acetylating)/methylmalonate-semialdehyde dehydrogenase